MKNLKESLNNLVGELSGILNTMLVSERINSQRCVAKDIDTTKTIINHKDETEEFTQNDLNSIGKELEVLTTEIKGIANEMLVSERINSQRCIAKDIDTTKTIFDSSDENKEFTKEDIKELTEEVKGIVGEMLVSERINSQRCVAKDIDTTKTIFDNNDKSEEVNKSDIENIIKELKDLVKMMLVSERVNSQRCVTKDIDTTKTIFDKNNK
ncbi:hypothetical protein CHF27_008805 [Romboutsia maritimum]|uniref:Uncharacterized protein n=1 Tax=Romboutsia maritimum TaxID=2020948 RepID=A0A371IS75_9FIRM|nr:hypothetical protein [Romboutsia maritimum]RDY23336.1 hypothetical protein CHF27_008805 [Romboutsia maritimum]